MKTFGKVRAVVLPLALLALVGYQGCGDNELEGACQDMCNKVAQCAAQIQVEIDYNGCVAQCNNSPNVGERDCALSCNRDLGCLEYGACVLGCGFIDNDEAVETNCRNACTRLDECAGELGLDVDVTDCTNDCVADDPNTQGCVFLCDTGAGCADFGVCVLECGLVQ